MTDRNICGYNLRFMKSFLRYWILLLILLGLQVANVRAQVTHTWNPTTLSGTPAAYDWGDPTNWLPTTVPQAADPVLINAALALFNAPTVTGTAQCASITFNALVSLVNIPLTVNGNLTVSGPIILQPTILTGYNVPLSGSGTLQCSSVEIGSTASLSSLLTFYDLRLISTIRTLKITGNVTVNSITVGVIVKLGGITGNFSLRDGTTTIDGQILTRNTTALIASSGIPTFSIDPPAGSNAILNLTNANAISTTAGSGSTLAGYTDFYNNAAGGTSTVNYTGDNQNIYTNTTSQLDFTPQTYQNLILSGTGTKTILGGSLTVANDFTSTAPNVAFNTNNPSAVIGHDWTNSSNVTQGTGDISVGNSLTNNAGGVLGLSSANLSIGGNYTNNVGGVYTQSTGNTNFTGTGAQTLTDNSTTGTLFKKVNFSGGGTATMTSGTNNVNFTLANTGLLTMSNNSKLVTGSTTAGGAAYFTLISNATSSAAVAAITGSSTIDGNVHIQRFLSGGGVSTNRGYRLMSSPVNQTQAASSPGNIISLGYLNSHTYNGTVYPGAFTGGPGGVNNGFSIANNNPTIYFYKEFLPISNVTFISGKHVGVYKITSGLSPSVDLSDGTANNVIPVGNGFLMFFIGPSSRTSGSSAIAPLDATLTAHGFMNQGPVKVYLWYTPKNGAANGTAGNLSFSNLSTANAQGNNMVGNPYPSTIKISTLLGHNTGVNNAYLLTRTNSLSQAYVAYTPNGSSAPSSDYVLSGQGFIVHTTGPNNSLTFNETDKVPAQQLTGSPLLMSTPNNPITVLHGGATKTTQSVPAPTEQPLTGMYMKMEKDTIIYNYCGIYFRNDWLANFGGEDARDLGGGAVSMASLSSDGVQSAVKHFPDYHAGARIKLFVDAQTNGQYNLKMEDVRNIDSLYNIYLMDNKMKDSLDIRHNGAYKFNIDRSDTTSFGGNRFELVIRRKALPPYSLASFKATKVTEGVEVSWITYGEGNYTGFVLQKQDAGSSASFNALYSKQSDGSSAYSYIDRNPVTGNNTYRLKQTDIDSKVSFSQTVSVDYKLSGSNGIFSIYPNPATEMISVNVSPDASVSSYTAYIYNSNGFLISKKATSSNNWSQNVADFKPGIYVIELVSNNGKLIGKSKFVKNQ